MAERAPVVLETDKKGSESAMLLVRLRPAGFADVAPVVDLASLIGYAAGIIIAIAYVPQVMKVYRTKSAKDLSKW